MTYKWNMQGQTTWKDGEAFGGENSSDDFNDTYDDAILPIGSIVAWLKSLTGTPTLPDGWVECNGQTLSDPESPLNGQTIPNLNGANSGIKRFLRGSTTSGTMGGNELLTTSTEIGANYFYYYASGGFVQGDIMPPHNHTVNALPPYYEVVWIMRVK